MMKEQLAAIENHLRLWILRYRMRRALLWGLAGAVGGAAIAMGIAIPLVWARALTLQQYILLVSLAPAGAFLLLGTAGILWKTEHLQVARFLESRYPLKDRLSTALEILPNPPANIPNTLLQHLAEDAAALPLKLPQAAFWRVRVERYQVVAVIFLISLAVGLGVWASPLFEQAAQKQALLQTIETQAIEPLEAVRAEVLADEALTDEQKAAIVDELNAAVEKLQQAQTLEQALSTLQQTQENLQMLNDAEAQQQAEVLRQLGQSLSQPGEEGQPENALQNMGEQLAAGNIQSAAQELANLDPTQMTSEQQQALAQQLQQAASALQSTNPQLAQQLQQAADALQNGDAQAAQQALQQAAQTMAQNGQQIAQAQAAQWMVSEVGQTGQQLLQAAQTGQGQQGQTGQGQQGQTGQGQQGGSSAGSGSSNGGQPGPEAPNTPIEGNGGAADGGETPFEPLNDPTRLGGSGGSDVTLPASSTPGDETLGQGQAQPGDTGALTVPYNDVYGNYWNDAQNTINTEQIPPGLETIIQEYFGSLQP